MGLERAYAAFVDSIWHLRQPVPPEHVAPGYVSHDPFYPREVGSTGIERHHDRLLAGLRAARYDIIESFAQDDRLAARYVATGVRADGARFAVHGVSINHAGAQGFREGWTLNDYRDLAVTTAKEPSSASIAGWDGEAIREAPRGSHLATYLALIHQLYTARVPKVGEWVDERYVSLDPFVARASGRTGVESFHGKVLARFPTVDYRVVDAVELGDRLAVRYCVRCERIGEPATVLGMSINHFENGKLRRGWVMNHYAGLERVLA